MDCISTERHCIFKKETAPPIRNPSKRSNTYTGRVLSSDLLSVILCGDPG